MLPEIFASPVWVANPASLQKLVGELVRQPRLAVDTESNSLYAFREQVCLIQFSTSQTDYLVDPLALDDLSPLASIFANPQIEKVIHAAENDLICLKRDFGITAANIFDTMQSARILGYKQVGLDSILAEILGVTLDKKYQKADWGERPLSREMLNYARLDTHYLLDLRDSLQVKLQERDRWDLAREEFVRLSQGNENDKSKVQSWQRVKGAQIITKRQRAILQELCTWRESQARRMDRPVFKVIDDRRLTAIAQAAPETFDELELQGLTTRQIRLYGNDLLRAIARGGRANPVNLPRPPRPNQAFLDRLDALVKWRKRTAEKMGVESDIILPKPFMHSIAGKNPRDLESLSALMPQSPWRLENFGGEILSVIHKIGKES